MSAALYDENVEVPTRYVLYVSLLVSLDAVTNFQGPFHNSSQKLRILVATEFLPPYVSGIANRCKNLIKGYRDQGHTVTVASVAGTACDMVVPSIVNPIYTLQRFVVVVDVTFLPASIFIYLRDLQSIHLPTIAPPLAIVELHSTRPIRYCPHRRSHRMALRVPHPSL